MRCTIANFYKFNSLQMFIYRIFSVLLFPVIELYLIYRVIKKKEDKSRLRERFGSTKQIRPEGDIIWLHAVSVGEANSSLVLVDDLLEKFVENFLWIIFFSPPPLL